MQGPVTIGIIGYGHVGRGVHAALKLPSYNYKDQASILVLDPAYQHTVSLTDMVAAKPNAIFLCLPTPSAKDGTCDATLVLQFVERLKDYTGLLIVKSTVSPRVVQKILDLRLRTLICPEFMRESGAEGDMVYPKVVVVGAIDDEDFCNYRELLQKHSRVVLQGPNAQDKMKWVSPVAASYFKYYVNTFLATKVAFTHEFVRAMQTKGDGGYWAEVQGLIKAEGRCGETHLDAPGQHGWGYAGSCFPKDVVALINELDNLEVLWQTFDSNLTLRKVNKDEQA